MKPTQIHVKQTATKLPTFRDLLPNLTGVGSLWVSDLLVEMIVNLVELAKKQSTGNDMKSIMNNLDLELGSGVMRPSLLKVVALVSQVSEWVSDGNDSKKLRGYVKGRLVAAAHLTGRCGIQLLDWVVEDMKTDLLDCRTDTVFDRRRAA